MARKVGVARGGRPSKGERRALMSRVPVEVADRVLREAEELDVSCSELIAHLLGARYGIEVPFDVSPDSGQKELALPQTA